MTATILEILDKVKPFVVANAVLGEYAIIQSQNYIALGTITFAS